MGKFKRLLLSLQRIFRYAVLGIGGLAAVLGFFADASGGATFWSLTGAQWFNLGLLLIALFVAWSIIRHDYLLHAFEEMWGNEHARKLMEDAIPPYRHIYFQYLRRGDYATVFRFWSAGHVNVSDHGDQTDLHIASESGHAAIARGVIERGGDPKRPDRSGRTPLMIAASRGHVAVAEALMEHDCAIHATATGDGVSALYAAAANGHIAMVDLLIRSGAPLDSVDHDNITPVMAAIAQRKWEIARSLIEAGADLRRVDASGATLRDYAERRGDTPPDIAEAITAQGIDFAQPHLKSTGGGHSGTGKVSVHWRPADEIKEDA